MKRERVVAMGFLLFGLMFFTACRADTTTAVSTSQTSTAASTVPLSTEEPLDYSGFPELIIGAVQDQLTMPENDYYIYYYGSICSYCSDIKQTVLHKIASLTVDKVYIVLVNTTSDIHGDINVTGVPAIVHIVDHQVESIHQNKTNVLGVLPELE